MERTTVIRSDRGSATVFLVIVMTASVGLIALVADGGAIQRARSETYGLASAAARAGAQQLDDDARARGDVVLDPAAATDAAQRHLAAHDTTGQVSVTGDTVTVTVDRTVSYAFRPGSATVSSTATVEAVQEPVS